MSNCLTRANISCYATGSLLGPYEKVDKYNTKLNDTYLFFFGE